jgi:methionine-rich copper-binding protein CopC
MPTQRTLAAGSLFAVAGIAGLIAVASSPVASASTVAERHADPRTLTITARDFAFEAPDTVQAGVTTIRLINKGPELHHVWLIRLDEGKTMNDVMAAMRDAGPEGPPPKWITHVGGPNAPRPGGESVNTLLLTPGRYVINCFIPSADGKPHVMKGMMKAFTVVPAPAATPATPASTAATGISTRPEPSVTMTLRDYGFDLSSPLTSGRHVIRVRNEAAQAHEVLFARLAPGRTAQDLVAWTEKPEGPPPALPLGGTVGMGHGVANDVVLDLEPGEYALLCFLPDAKDGRPHVAHGMIQQVSVK